MPNAANELTLAHSGTIVDDKGGDIFFVSHGCVFIGSELRTIETLLKK